MEYDLINLFDQPVYLCDYIAYAIATFGSEGSDRCAIQVEWKPSAGEAATQTELTLKWDLEALRARHPLIDRQLQSLRERDEDQATQTEYAAVVVAVAVMTCMEPGTRFTLRLAPGKRHDYCLNDTLDEMIEIAGRWGDKDGLPDTFEKKRAQSDKYPEARKRWVSVTIARATPRNRTEGLHTCPPQ
jgi:hypothetical protein